MVWVFLVLAAVSWLVVTLISEQERGEAVSISSRVSAGALRVREEWPRIAAALSRASHRALDRLRLLSTARRRGRSSRLRGDGWRSRLVALLQLILFVMLISALFAGAIAAAAMRIGHLGA